MMWLRISQELPLAPATFVRSLARKLGAEPEEPPPPRKAEDELLQSIIQPLELEIGALKNKLRENDALLQDALVKRRRRGRGDYIMIVDRKILCNDWYRYRNPK